jgi:hypothetical protein
MGMQHDEKEGVTGGLEEEGSAAVSGAAGGTPSGDASEEEHAELLASGWARVRKIGLRTVQICMVVFALLVIIRIPVVLEREETEKVVAQIHATKLTMDDVMGVNLPPDPGSEADMTVAGVDVNKNGIRDDVELAIFREYATSSKTRAVLLQYALALQMEFTQSLVNTETVIAVAQEEGRANACIGESLSRDDMKEFVRMSFELQEFVEGKQLNSTERKQAQKDFYNDHLKSYSAIRDNRCDLDLESL